MKRRSVRADLLSPKDQIIFAQQTCAVFSSICVREFGWKTCGCCIRKIANHVRVKVNLRLESGQFVLVEFKPSDRLRLANTKSKAGAA